MQMTKTSDQRSAISFFKFMETAPVKKSAHDGVHVELFLGVSRDDSIKLIGIVKRFLRLDHISSVFFRVAFHVQISAD